MFNAGNQAAIHTLFAGTPLDSPALVQEAELSRLPEAIRHWLTASRVVGKIRARSVRLRQHGFLRAPDGGLMPVRASQYFRVDRPGFVWCAAVRLKSVIPVAVRDSYLAGKGRSLVRLISLIPLADADGPKIDEGTLQRFLAETILFPSALLDLPIRWQGIDARTAEATLDDHGVSATVRFHFDDQGRFIRLTAERFKDSGPDAKREHWLVIATAWRELAGVVVPCVGEVIWRLSSGDLTVYQWTLDELEYNRPHAYAKRP